MPKEHRNDLAGLRLQFWVKLANVKESFMQCEEYNSRTGSKISANHLAGPCWEEPIIDKIGLSGMFSLCVLGKPYIRSHCEPDKCRTKRALKYVKIMLPLFHAVVAVLNVS